MFERKKLLDLEEYFLDLGSRREHGVFFCRICGYHAEIKAFVQKYYDSARKSGVVIEGRIPNPDEKNLAYYGEIMGMDFCMEKSFLAASLQKWLPRMNGYQRENVAQSLYGTLEGMRREGKNENMLKNAYIKFMCWLYYRFERIVNQLGAEHVPKILYEGEVSNYELKMFDILSHAGCDIVLLQYQGDASYQKLDPASKVSDVFQMPGMEPFPDTFHLKFIRKELEQEMERERLYGKKPELTNATNAWIEGKGLSDIRKEPRLRGEDPKLFYNCFLRICGVEDKMTYLNELYQFQLELKNSKRSLVVVEHQIQQPTMEEINAIHRKQYAKQEQMLMDLSANIKYTANQSLQRILVKAFLDVLFEEAGKPDMNLNKLTNKAVYLLCWLNRYQPKLFCNWKQPDIGCFIYLGGCRTELEAMFLRFLARLPVDVLVLVPDLSRACCLTDRLLYEIHYEQSMAVEKFPRENAEIRMGTAAYHAERELDSVLYQDSGMYRDRQYGKSNAVSLQTMYEEIELLWDQELKYRPNFSTVDSVVNIPVLFAKVSGVKDGNVPAYWDGIRKLVTEHTVVARTVPYVEPEGANPIKPHVTAFFKNGKLLRAKIKEHPSYPYGFLREEIQEHILDKLQLLIEQRLIKGTFENGMEYTIIATILNMKMELVRLIQGFDFTKKNPKFLYINTTERMISLEDAILAAFLNLAGFDVLFLIPTGYQNIEKFYNGKIMEEHQIGEYLYDLRVPDFGKGLSGIRQSWRERLFKRGN